MYFVLFSLHLYSTMLNILCSNLHLQIHYSKLRSLCVFAFETIIITRNQYHVTRFKENIMIVSWLQK